jgi:ubiquinone/menaquinone biosynthesis C-methylase UbiE
MQYQIYRIQVFIFSVLFLSACNEEHKSQPQSGSVVLTSATKDSQPNPVYSEIPEASNTFEGLVSDFENKDRVIWQKPDLVINLLGDLRGKTVADIGAGTGYFAFRMIPKAKKVIAIDIDKRLITFMDSIKVRLSPEAQARFETRLTAPDNPQIAENEADIVMLVDTYGYIKHREKYLKHLMKGLKANGEILIIDFKKENLPADVAGSFTIALSSVVKELETAGFVIAKVDNTALDYQYIIQAKKPTNN